MYNVALETIVKTLHTTTVASDAPEPSNSVLQGQKWVCHIPTCSVRLIVEFQLKRFLPHDATEDHLVGPLMVVVLTVMCGGRGQVGGTDEL